MDGTCERRDNHFGQALEEGGHGERCGQALHAQVGHGERSREAVVVRVAEACMRSREHWEFYYEQQTLLLLSMSYAAYYNAMVEMTRTE